MNKYDGTLEWTQFSFKISFLKVFFTTAGLSTPRCDLNGLLIHQIY